MKSEIHPKNYRMAVFEDTSSGARFLLGTTLHSDQETTWEDGKTYPLIRVEISSQSHPFYTGKETGLSARGRADRFRKMQEKTEALKSGSKA
jgi:large subunit ribosomal protein L31